MANIDPKELSDGTIRYRVEWRHGGRRDGLKQKKTMRSERDAQVLVALVNANGQVIPDDATLRAVGLDYLIEEPQVAPRPVVTVVDYVRQFVDSLDEPRRETVAKYSRYVDSYVQPFFKDMPLTEADRTHTRAWQRWMVAEGGRTASGKVRPLSGNTVGKVRAAVLYPAFAASCQRQDDGSAALRDWNPFDNLAAPRKEKNPVDILETAEEATILVRAAYELDDQTGDAIVMMLATAFRWGELFGLTRPVIVPPKQLAEVRKVNAADIKGRYRLRDEPKSDDGWRRINYATTIAPLVQRRRDQADNPQGLLFAAPRGDVWQSNNWHARRWQRVRQIAVANGLERTGITPHGLRHSAITYLGETPGIDRVALQVFAGHESAQTTAGYMHFTGRGALAINTALDGFLAGVVKGTPAAA